MTVINSVKSDPTQNSYASTDEADDFLETVYGSDDWFALTDAKKEQLLMTATRAINGLRIIYPSTTSTQSLKFPVSTSNGTDQEGRPLGDGFDKVREATIIQAFYLFQHADGLQEAEANRVQGITDQRIATMSWSANGYDPMTTIKPQVFQILKPYIDLTVRATR